MAGNQPGLAPRKLEGEVALQVESNRLPDASTGTEQPSVEQPVQSQAPDNTEATVKPTENNVEAQAQVEQPLTNRAEQRIQSLANEKAQAEARAAYFEQLAQRLVNVQPQQPIQSEAEVLSKQYKTFNSSLGYPEDPKEYASYVATNARLEAQRESQRQAAQIREQQETAEFVRAYPNAVNDPVFMGAMSAVKAQAQRQGAYLSYKDAAQIADKQIQERVSKKVVQDVANNDRSKDEAYVESTRGASSSSRAAGTRPDVDNMSLAEKEAWLRENNAW